MVAVLVALLIGLAIPQATPAASGLQASIAALGSFDFKTRTEASRRLRREPAAVVVPALEAAARSHADEYVRFRAMVLLSGLDPGATTRVATDLVADRNDRVRAVAYQWFERHPESSILPRLLAALPEETSEFVRPALTRALASSGRDPAVQQALRPLVLKGEDLFRGSVIAALGDHAGDYALEELLAVVSLDGPLQDDAITAIGQIGRPSSRGAVAALQKDAPPHLQPTVSAALCLLQLDCPARVKFVVETVRFAAASDGQLPLLRGAVHAAGVLAGAGHNAAFDAMVDAALAADGAVRDTITLGVGNVILDQPLLALQLFEARKEPAAVAGVFRDAFDMLAEDFDKEQFGAEVRRLLQTAPEGAARRQAAASLLDALEF
jgi:hypothetical protein